MYDLIELTDRLPSWVFSPKTDDDFTDRLNYRYTVGMLILFSMIILTRQYGSDASFLFHSFRFIFLDSLY
jgi:hypothetical protein